MKIITLKQPWASLISNGLKEYEFRSWKTNYRGELLIHAGKGIDKEALEKYKYLNINFPISSIVAKVNVVDCIKLDANIKRKIKEEDPDIYNISKDAKYAWKLENIIKIDNYNNVSGKQGLWNFDYK